MRRFILFELAIFLLFMFSACGKIGDPLPPLVMVPKPVEQFDLAQEGTKLNLDWQLPTVYTDGTPIPGYSSLEFWMLREDKIPESELPALSVDRFRELGEIVLDIPLQDFSKYQPDPEKAPRKFQYEHPLLLEELGKIRITFALVVKDNKRRYSSFSQLRTIEPLLVSLTASELKGEVFKDHISVTWTAPIKNLDDSEPAAVKGYNLYRLNEEGEPFLLNPSPIVETKFDDQNFSFGSTYFYFVRTVANDVSPYIESSASPTLEVLAKDVFPPAVPKGLVAIAGEDFVSLSWDLGRDSDLSTFKIWRRQSGDKEFQCLTPDGIPENAYTDHSVGRDKTYEYSVTAVDGEGNESNPSKQVSIFVRG